MKTSVKKLKKIFKDVETLRQKEAEKEDSQIENRVS